MWREFFSYEKAALCRLFVYLGLVVISVLCAGSLLQAAQRVQVRYVPDGDTVILTTGQSLRLWGIDAPEMGRDGKPDQYYARESRRELIRLVADQELRFVAAPRLKDAYGRLLGTLLLPEGGEVNVELVRLGLAFCLPFPRQDGWMRERLLVAQQQALAHGKGFWPHVLRHMERYGEVRGNKNSLRFFYGGCDGWNRISPRNRVPFSSAAAAFNSGYAPARHCGMWPCFKAKMR